MGAFVLTLATSLNWSPHWSVGQQLISKVIELCTSINYASGDFLKVHFQFKLNYENTSGVN